MDSKFLLILEQLYQHELVTCTVGWGYIYYHNLNPVTIDYTELSILLAFLWPLSFLFRFLLELFCFISMSDYISFTGKSLYVEGDSLALIIDIWTSWKQEETLEEGWEEAWDQILGGIYTFGAEGNMMRSMARKVKQWTIWTEGTED